MGKKYNMSTVKTFLGKTLKRIWRSKGGNGFFYFLMKDILIFNKKNDPNSNRACIKYCKYIPLIEI